MNRIVGIFQNMDQADRLLEALNNLGIANEALYTYSRSHIEVEEVEDNSTQEIMVTAYVKDDKMDQVKTIFKNSEAKQVNVWGEDWIPQTTWSPIVYGRSSN